MSVSSDPALLALHAVRLLGAPGTEHAAGLFGLAAHDVHEYLLDAEAAGLVTRYRFDGVSSWALTDRGREQDSRLLSAELDRTASRQVVLDAHAAFLPLNTRLTDACTRWQLRPYAGDPMAVNDHTDWRWDERVIADLVSIGRRLRPIAQALSDRLTRFGVHEPRFRAALAEVGVGRRSWVDAPDRASVHIVWIQLHEDLLSTLNLTR